MESKFVFRARTVFQNAAAKAERVLTEIKADFVSEFSSHSQDDHDGELPWVGKSELEKNLEDECRKRILDISKNTEFLLRESDGRIDVDMQSAMRVLELDENLKSLRFQSVPKAMKEREFWRRYFAAVKQVKQEVYNSLDSIDLVDSAATATATSPFRQNPSRDSNEDDACSKAAIPSSRIIRRLASAIETGRCFESCEELALSDAAAADKDSGDWSSIVSGLKKISLRDRERKSRTQSWSARLLQSLFDSDLQRQECFPKLKLPEELHGAAPGSFVSQLAEAVGGLKSEHKMAHFWIEVVNECRRCWDEGRRIPRVPRDSIPDLNYCLLFQQMQVLNCCMARMERRRAALDSLNSPQERFASESGSGISSGLDFAKLKDGQLVQRYCVDRQTDNLVMLETGEPIYSPITQEGPVLTEELIRETEELVLRTGSFGAGCSQLFSDMQAFKAANPGCILEDFVRWYSPLDWRETTEERPNESSVRGSLSARMKCEGNLWQELWSSARPIPAVMQAPLFDEELAGESTLDALENINPGEFFEQLFITALSAGFAIAESNSSAAQESLRRCLKECRDYILSTCHRHMDSGTVQDLCEVYELMEKAIQTPPEDLDPPLVAEKSESKTILADIRKLLLKKQTSFSDDREQQQRQQRVPSSSHGNPMSSVVKFFESKFDRRSKQAPIPVEGEGGEKNLCSTESGDWTIVS